MINKNVNYKVVWCYVMNGIGKLWKGLSLILNMFDYSVINFEIGIFIILYCNDSWYWEWIIVLLEFICLLFKFSI